MRHAVRVHLFCSSTDHASREVRTVTYLIGGSAMCFSSFPLSGSGVARERRGAGNVP
jgi:hypothetical protein